MSDYNHYGENNGSGYTPPNHTYPNYSYGNFNSGQPGPNEPRPPKKKKGMAGIIAAVAASGVIAGSLLTAFVVMPTINKTIVEPLQQQVQQNDQPATTETITPNTEQGEATHENTTEAQEPQPQADPPPLSSSGSTSGTGEVPNLGGDGMQIENTANPVPEIAKNAKQSVVGVSAYAQELITGQEPMEQRVSSGTGFVISEDGYIVTNNHVIADGNLIKIVTADGTEHVAELVGKDSATELAVLKVEGLDIEPLALGNSDEVETGELVVAIGNPLGDELQNTVTVGYLSSESRQVMMDGVTEMSMLQTDAAINPGNSGGPLLNSEGEVIGINTMKSIFAGFDEYGNTISAEGIGFAIPISDAMGIVETLITDGGIVKPGIGFTYEHISAQDASLWGAPQGIVIRTVEPGSPAEKAGLMPNDIISSIDGVDLSQEGVEVPKFSEREVGEEIPAIVWRNGRDYKATFVLADLNNIAG